MSFVVVSPNTRADRSAQILVGKRSTRSTNLALFSQRNVNFLDFPTLSTVASERFPTIRQHLNAIGNYERMNLSTRHFG